MLLRSSSGICGNSTTTKDNVEWQHRCTTCTHQCTPCMHQCTPCTHQMYTMYTQRIRHIPSMMRRGTRKKIVMIWVPESKHLDNLGQSPPARLVTAHTEDCLTLKMGRPQRQPSNWCHLQKMTNVVNIKKHVEADYQIDHSWENNSSKAMITVRKTTLLRPRSQLGKQLF